MIEGPRVPDAIERFLLTALALVLVSAVWIETDAYRYAAAIIFIYGAWRYWTANPRPAIGWAGWLCLAWSLFVAIRYGTDYIASPGDSLGSSEGIYLFPAVYSTIGFAFSLQPRAVAKSLRYFIVISFAVAVATVQIVPSGNAEIYNFLLTNNTIHSSVCGGLIIFAALNFSTFVWRRDPSGIPRIVFLAAVYATAVLCAIGIYWARSRGVWVAIGFGLIAQLALSLHRDHDWRRLAAGASLLAAFAVFLVLDHADIWAKIGPSADAAWTIAASAYRSGDLSGALHEAIASGTVPVNMNERLMLWSNAVETWSHNIAFGNGIGWEQTFLHARYGDVGYNLLHNGYLEIAVRYGILGLAFYALLFGWSLAQSLKACRAGLIAREAFAFHAVSLVFFLATILTNSNNRLAIGESYMMVMVAFGFYCDFQRQRALTDPGPDHGANSAASRA